MKNETAYAELQAAGLVTMDRTQILQDGTVQPYWNCAQNNMQQTAAFYTKLDGVYAGWNTLNSRQALTLGGAWVPVLKASEAFAFDSKYDDGVANTGTINGINTVVNAGSCTSGWSNAQFAPYNFGSYYSGGKTGVSCYLTVTIP
jgi:hypothetical protein